MGKKTDRIEELETIGRTALRFIRAIGNELGIETTDIVLGPDMSSYWPRFKEAVGAGNTPVAQPAGPAPGAPWHTFDDDVDAQIDRLAEQGLTKPRSPIDVRASEQTAIMQRPPGLGSGDTGRDTGRMQVLMLICHELGITTDHAAQDPDGALHTIYHELLRLKGTSGEVSSDSDDPHLSKGDSLAEAIDHNRAQSRHHLDEVTRLRSIVNRVAASMQIGQWDADGTEILERVQRWESIQFKLLKDLKAWRSVLGEGPSVSHEDHARTVAGELEVLLVAMTSPTQVAKWMATKPNTTQSAIARVAVLSILGDPSPGTTTIPRLLSAGDIAVLCDALEAYPSADECPHRTPDVQDQYSTMAAQLLQVFTAIRQSRVATDEIVNLVNLLVLPILARQGAFKIVSGGGSGGRSTGSVGGGGAGGG